MPENGYNRSQFLPFGFDINQRRFVSIIHFESFKNIRPTLPLRKESVHNLLFQDICAILPILDASFDERPTIHITNIRFSICTQQVKTANFLPKFLNDPIADELFSRSQDDRISDLFSLRIPKYNAIKGWGSSSLCIHVV